jgi:hypothetical protein
MGGLPPKCAYLCATCLDAPVRRKPLLERVKHLCLEPRLELILGCTHGLQVHVLTDNALNGVRYIETCVRSVAPLQAMPAPWCIMGWPCQASSFTS